MNERATRTREEYGNRLEQVVAWLADHLDESLDLARLADVACMSPYHFHRVYHAMQGETAADTVRRLRLDRAAVELITGEWPVARIAGRAGYGTQQAFTRAFKAAYGVPPARYRASCAPLTTTGTHGDPMQIAAYDASIREVPAVRVGVLAHRGPYHKIGAVFQRLSTMAAGRGFFSPTTRAFGIYYDDPSVTPRAALRSEACITVPDDWTPTGNVQLGEIRGGRYAVTSHRGPYPELGSRYMWLYGTWLPHSGEEPADAPCVEAYLNDARCVPPSELETEIWLPLR
jgi:AraC family transcriptional regulator